MLKRILVAVTGTPCGATAIRYAVELAQVHRAKLTGVTLVDARRIQNVGPVPIGAGSAAKELREHRMFVAHSQQERAIDGFRSACNAAGVTCSVEMEEGDACNLMVMLSRYHDLTVFGLRGLFAYGYPCETQGLLGPLVSKGIRPLLAVSEEYRTVRRVLIAYSGSMESAKTMRRFAQIRAWPDVELEIAVFRHPHETASRLIADAIDYFRDHGFHAQAEHLLEEPREALLAHAAQRNVDLIVMGYSIRSHFSKLLLGETGLHVIRHTDRPLFMAQ